MAVALAAAGAIVAGLLAILMVGLLRSHAEILKALHDLGVNLEDGAPRTAHGPRPTTSSAYPPGRTAEGVPGPRGGDAPLGVATDLDGTLPQGGAAHVAVVGVESSTLLAFLSTGCGTCGVFWEELQDLHEHDVPGIGTRVVIVTQGPESESMAEVASRAPADVLTVMSSQAWDDYGVPVSPYFVLTDGRTGRVVGEGAGTSWAQVLELLSRAAVDSRTPTATDGADLTRMGGQDRAEWVDRQLTEAGLQPGDPSLYPPAHPSHAHGDVRSP